MKSNSFDVHEITLSNFTIFFLISPERTGPLPQLDYKAMIAWNLTNLKLGYEIKMSLLSC